ncbi:MAG: hypothetical protein GY711_29475 [bacterium]|nr:hypothetical protein [bacterium]
MAPYDETPAEEFQDPQSGPQINIAEVGLHALARFPFTILVLTGLGTIGGLVFGLAQPNLYKSIGLLLVRQDARDQRTPTSAVDEDLGARGGGIGTADELLILRNPKLNERVLEKVGVAKILTPYDPSVRDNEKTSPLIRSLHEFQAKLMGISHQMEAAAKPMTPERRGGALQRLAGGIEVGAQRSSSTIVVGFTAQDPALAQEIVTAYLDVFQARHREVYETTDELDFLNDELEKAQAAAKKADEALLARKELDGITDWQTTINSLTTQVQELELQSQQDEVQREKLKGQLTVIDEQIAANQPEEAEETEVPVQESRPVVLPNPIRDLRYEELKGQLKAARDELTKLAGQFAEGSRYMQEARTRLEPKIAKIEAEMREIEEERAAEQVVVETPETQVADGPNLILQKLESERLTTLQEQAALASGLAARNERLDAYRTRLDALSLLEPDYARLEAAVEDTRATVQRITEARDGAETMDRIERDERMTNLIVTQEPTRPTQKVGPNRTKFLGMGVFAGLAAGIFLAVTRQIMDSRLRYPKAVEASLGIRVLGVVPEERQWRRQGKRLHQITDPRE